MIHSLKHILSGMTILLFTMPYLSSCSNTKETPHVRIGLCQQNMLDRTPQAIRNKFPNVDFEFVVTNNSADYNVYLKQHDDLPDILTIRRFSLSDAVELKDTLVDLKTSDIAAGYYQNYLQNFTYEDGTVNWLPAVAEVWGIVANKTLFDENKIDIPTDYDSFISACQQFEEKGIKGFETDWKYDYSSLETLEGFNIETLQSLDGKRWRLAYESGMTTGADDTVWPKMFEHMYDMLEKTNNIDPEGTSSENSLIKKGYSNEKQGIQNGSIAMIRASGADIVGYTNDTNNEYIMLPYFGVKENWLLTYPYYSAAINKNSKIDQNLLMDIYEFMLGQNGQDTLDTGEYMLSYTKDVTVQANELLKNLEEYVKNNKIFIRLANNSIFASSMEAVQGMIQGKYNASQAYTAFDTCLKKEAEGISYDYYVDKGYSYSFDEKKGSESVSAILNSAREVWRTDLAVTYAPCYSNSIYEGKASSSRISYYLSANPPADYYLSLTGAEVKRLVSAMLHHDANENGFYGGMNPVSNDMLPVSSGFEMKIKKTGTTYSLSELTINSEPIDKDKTYSICFNIPSYYASYIAGKANITIPSDSLKALPAIADTLKQYLITEKKQFASPSSYIVLES